MGCSVINDKIHMKIGTTRTGFNIWLGRNIAGEQNRASSPFRSALQSPELSQAELAALLRAQRKNSGSEKEHNTYWAGLMARYTGQSANSNDHGNAGGR